MIFDSYGISLVRLHREQIEMVRNWRNHPRIRDFMEYRKQIRSEDQIRWFEAINNTRNFYFVIRYHDDDIGLIHCSGIDWEGRVGDTGLFIWDDRYINTQLPVFASLALLDFCFGVLKLSKVTAKVMQSNKRAVAYNMRLGYKLEQGQGDCVFCRYYLDADVYPSFASLLRNWARKVGGDHLDLRFNPEIDKVDDQVYELLLNLHPNMHKDYEVPQHFLKVLEKV